MAHIALVQWLHSSLVSVVFLIVGILALTTTTFAIRSWLTIYRKRKHEQQHLLSTPSAEEQARAMQEVRAAVARGLYQELLQIEYALCGTDEHTELDRRFFCEEVEIPYQMPMPERDAMELHIEVVTLQKVIFDIHANLCRYRHLNLNLEFYRCWVTSLQKKCAPFYEQRQSLQRMMSLLPRLQELEMTLRLVHGVRRVQAFPAYPVKTAQDLFSSAKALRDRLESRLSRHPHTMFLEAEYYEQRVERLERQHQELDGFIDLFHDSDIAEQLKQAAHHAWDTIICYAFESKPDILLDYYLESEQKYLRACEKAKHLLEEEGKCGQKAAMERVRKAMEHWGYRQALHLALNEERDPEQVQQAYDLFLKGVERKIPHLLWDLQASMAQFSLDAPLRKTLFL